MTTVDEGPFARTISGRIAWAGKMFLLHGETLKADQETMCLAADFAAAHKASQREALRAGIVSLCTVCDREEGGSCCGAGIELKYDGWILLVNLLLGIELPKRRERAECCFFLGEKGCILAAREVLCINYLCRKVFRNVPSKALASLRKLEGQEIEVLFRLTEHVKTVIQARNSMVI